MSFLRVLVAILLISGLDQGCFWQTREDLAQVRRSIFKVTVVAQEAKSMSPWEFDSANSSSGTGFYIGDNRVVTNAHVIANAKYITLLRDGDADSVPAYVTFVAHDCDLAIVTVKDAHYFDGVEALKFGSLPKLRSPVSAVGYPLGGEQLSITEGVVSRVGFRRYSHSGSDEHIQVQVDSAINPGNSGGPVFQNGKVVGVAFQGHTSAQNTGYIIPTVMVERFLKDIKDGTYDGHPDLGLIFLPEVMENAGTRRYAGLKDSKIGVKISDVAEFSPAFGQLRAGDILLSTEGRPIGSDGRIEYEGERVDLRVLSDLQQVGEKAKFEIMRDGKKTAIEIKMKQNKPHPYEGKIYAERPRYLVYAGLVFTELSQNYLRTWGNRWYEDSPTLLRYALYYARFISELKNAHEIVVYRGRLPHKVNAFAEPQKNSILKTLNQMPIQSMGDLAKALANPSGDYTVFEFYEEMEPIVIPTKAAQLADQEINQRYHVDPHQWLFGQEVDGAVHLEAKK